jgi:hypothetical protein
MDASDPRFQQMTQQAGALKDQIADTNAVVKATAGSGMENLAGSVAKVGQIGVAAFQGMQSSMMLMGVENDNILAGMAKLQALAGLGDALGVLGGMGDKFKEITAGVTAFGSKAIGAFSGMTTAGKVFAVTGIGLIVTALGYAIANWDKISASIGKQTAAQRVSNEVTKQATASIANELSAADKLQRQLKNETLTRAEKIQKVREFQASYPGLLQNMNLEAMSIDQINTQLTKNIELLRIQAEQKAIEAVRAEKLQKKLTIQLDEISTAQQVAGEWFTIDYGETAANGWIGFSTQAENAQKAQRKLNEVITVGTKAIDADINALDKQSDANEKKIAQMTKNGAQNSGIIKDYSKMTTGTQAHTAAVNDNSAALERQRKELERLNNIGKLRTEALDAIQQAESEYQDSLLSQQQQEINAVRDKYFILIEDAKKYGQDTAILEEAQQSALTAIDDKYSKQREDIEKKRRENILTQQEEFDEQYQQAINSDKQNEINAVREKYFTLIETAKQYGYDTKVLEEKLQKELKGIDDKYAKEQLDKDKKKNEEKWKTTQEFAQKATDFLKKQSDERIALIDKEIAAAEKQADFYRDLAANGNINAQQSLAEQERIIAESNRRKEREQKRQQRMELANTIYQTYASHAAKDPKTALMNTIKDASLLQAFISSLPMFYDGTEDTGRGGGVDGKGGFHAVLHPHERVIPKSLNDQIGNLSNEQLTRLAMEYQNGRLVGQDVAHSSLDLAIMVNELRDLKEVIKQKPETNIQLGEITQSAMEIVQSTRKGNTTIYNRFKVRS